MSSPPFFNLLTSEASLRQAVQGLVDAVLISLTVGGYLLYVRDGWLRLWFRRLGFWTELVLSSTIVLTLFLVMRAAGQVLTTQMPRRFLASFTDAHLMVALPFFAVIAVTMQFILQMNRMLGINVLGYFAAGVYRRPKAEGARLPLHRPGRLDAAGGAAGQRPLLRAAPPLRRRSVRAGGRGRRRDLPVRGRRGRDHLAAGGRRARGQLR